LKSPDRCRSDLVPAFAGTTLVGNPVLSAGVTPAQTGAWSTFRSPIVTVIPELRVSAISGTQGEWILVRNLGHWVPALGLTPEAGMTALRARPVRSDPKLLWFAGKGE